MKNRTPNQLPNNLYLGDVDGDGTDEFLQVADNRLFVFRTNYEATGVLHHYFAAPISRLIVGDFTKQGREHGRDQVCVVLADGSMQVYASSDDLQELWWWFTQGSIVQQGEQVIVGDFDGDGADDILVHNPTSGTLRMYSRMATGYFALMPGFAPGNLSTANLVGKQILAGEFGQAVGRDDLLVIDHLAGQISRYDSATDQTGTKTFWWAFTTNASLITTHDQVVVANIDGGATDNILIHHIPTGAYRICKAEYSNGNLVGIPDVKLGQLPVQANHSVVASARLKEAVLRSETGGAARHDFLLFDRDTGQVTRTDGRSDGSRFTYWWAYTKATPHYNQGWPARRNEKWAVLLTHMADNTQKPQPLDFFKRLFTSAGSGGLTDYFMDISYGTLDIGSTEVLPPGENTEWYKIRYTTANSPHGQVEDPVDHQMKEARQVLFDEAVRDSGVDPSKYGHIVAVFNVAKTAYGGSTTFVTIDPLDSTTKSGFQTTGVSHEMLHGYGLDHSYDDQNHEYGDQWDIMSAQNDYTFTGFNQANSGPELNAPYKAKLGFLPDSRVLILTPNPSHPQTHTASLAAINRPEANGYLAVKIRIPPQGGVGAPDHAFFIEFRQKSFWDRAIPQDAVLIHEYGSARSFLQTSQKGPQYTQGITFQDENFTVTIQQVHGSDHQKEVLASTAVLAITC